MDDDDDDEGAATRSNNADRKAKQRWAVITERRATAESIDAALIKVFKDLGRQWAEGKAVARSRTVFELPLIRVLEKVAVSFPADQRRKVFKRLGFNPEEFLDKNGNLKERSS